VRLRERAQVAVIGASPSGLAAAAANQFFSQSLGVLVRDVEIRSIIATHTYYLELDGYQAVRARLLTEVAIPPLSEPRAAIGTILQRRIDVSDVDATVTDVFTDDALTRLVAEYDHSNRSIRHVPAGLRHRTRTGRAHLPGPPDRRPPPGRIGRAHRARLVPLPKIT
jgi:hypothetical protein